MTVEQILSFIASSLTGANCRVSGSQAPSATPVIDSGLGRVSFLQQDWKGTMRTNQYACKRTLSNIVDIPFSLNEWGTIYAAGAYIRGANVFAQYYYPSTYNSFWRIKSIDGVEQDGSRIIGIIYEQETLKMAGYKFVRSGAYLYVSDIVYLAGKTVEVYQQGTGNGSWLIKPFKVFPQTFAYLREIGVICEKTSAVALDEPVTFEDPGMTNTSKEFLMPRGSYEVLDISTSEASYTKDLIKINTSNVESMLIPGVIGFGTDF